MKGPATIRHNIDPNILFFMCQYVLLAKFGRKKDFGIKQVLFAGFFSEIFSDPAQIDRRDEEIRSYIPQ